MDLITKRPTFFKNDNEVALNELNIMFTTVRKVKKLEIDKDITAMKDNLKQYYETRPCKIPALDPSWIQKSRSYYPYQPYFVEVRPEENQCFLEKNRLFLQSLDFLLQCSYHQFWCYLLYEKRVKRILESFVLNAVPWYELKHVEDMYFKLYEEMFNKVADVYSRMFTYKESQKEYMSESTVIRLITVNNLIQFPELTQLCSLYHQTNPKLVANILIIFTNTNNIGQFKEDIQKMIEHTLTAFDVIKNQFCKSGSATKSYNFGMKPRPAIFDPNWFDEVICYLVDAATTINSFFKFCNVGVEVALLTNFFSRLTDFYNVSFSAIYRAFEDRGELPEEWVPIKNRVFDNIATARSECVDIFQHFVAYHLDNIAKSRGSSEIQEHFFETYLALITSNMEEDFFIFDYHNTYAIDFQLEQIKEFYPELDSTRTDYIIQCLSTMPDLKDLLLAQEQLKIIRKTPQKEIETQLLETEEETEPASIEPPEEIIEEYINTVLETLPHLGDGFILECLRHYSYSPYDVIAAILDQNLSPAVLAQPDAIRVPPEIPERVEQPILAYRGKKPTFKDAKDMLDDVEGKKAAKEFVLKASYASFEQYDDDYDDRDEDGGSLSAILAYNRRVREQIAADEADPYKYMENRFANMNVVSDPSSSSDEEAAGEQRKGGGGGRGRGARGRSKDSRSNQSSATASSSFDTAPHKRPDFCANPEETRARWEAGRRGGAGAGAGGARDVTGRPRGEGQDASVQHNRDKKGANKSSRGNHSRKRGADFKRSRGMMPG